MDLNIKTVNISGGAADCMAGTKKKRRNTKKKQDGGASDTNISPTIIKGVESNNSVASTASSVNSSSWLKYPTGAPVPPLINVMPSHVPRVESQQGGTKHFRVELKKKIPSKKVQLNPKKLEAPKLKKNTKKVRKITLGVSTFHKRITRAKKLHKKVKELPLDKLKEKLIKDGLIKSTSKAPESVLRQMANDAEVVAKKAL